tara:strand:+ start:164 stop:520 length:357 start_codon:yes stop_codon:yes gene_type:complete
VIKNYQNKLLQIGGINYGNIDSLFEFIRNKTGVPDTKTEKRYCVILYGVPGAGKTIARKIACSIIKNEYKENMSLKNIHKSFIDTGVDDIIYDIKANGEIHDIKTQLIDNKNKVFLSL